MPVWADCVSPFPDTSLMGQERIPEGDRAGLEKSRRRTQVRDKNLHHRILHAGNRCILQVSANNGAFSESRALQADRRRLPGSNCRPRRVANSSAATQVQDRDKIQEAIGPLVSPTDIL